LHYSWTEGSQECYSWTESAQTDVLVGLRTGFC
ncbi:hypothetical protein AVEN_275026-2-1, partial [Araneus ventricosus]